MKFRVAHFAFIVMLVVIGVTEDPVRAQGSSSDGLANQKWVRLGGPSGGLGYDIRMRPDNPDVMYVTDAWAGVHKSTDGGKTWFPLNQGIDLTTGPSGDAIPVFCLTVDPNNYDTLWIGLQAMGAVYRSTDGGETWQRRFNGIVEGEGLTIRGITIQPGNSDVIYVAGEISSWKWAGKEITGHQFDPTKGVVYKSIDGGAHWIAVWRGDNLARYIWIDPSSLNTVYVSTGIFDREAANSNPTTNTPGGVGILKSTDGGKTWKQINNGLNNLYVGSLFMDPKDPQTLLAGVGNEEYGEGGGIYITHDGGEHWNFEGGEGVAGEEITSVEFANDPNIAYAGGQGQFYRSDDGGQTWQMLVYSSGWGWGPAGIRPGFPIDFQVDPRNPMRIFVNNYGGGNFLSEDGGKSWVSSSTGYTGADLTAILVNPQNPAIVYANGRNGPFVSQDGGRTWQGINPVDLRVIAEGARIALDPKDPTHVLISSAHWGWIYESKDAGQHWQLVTDYREKLQALPYADQSQKFQGLQAIAFAPSDPKIIYGGFGVWRCATDADPYPCATKTLFSLINSKDGGQSWTPQTGTALDGLTVTDIVIHPTNEEIAWASTAGGGVFHTEDGGNLWKSLSSGLPPMVMDLALDPTDLNVIYAATATRGIFKSLDGGKSWKTSNVGMDPNEPIGSIVIDPVHPNVIYAGSWRSGVYWSKDGGKTWGLISNGLHTRSVRTLSISSDGETLYAGTRGEGVFRLSTHDQSYFDMLIPTPTPISITPTSLVAPPLPPLQTPQANPSSTPAPRGSTSSLQLWEILLIVGLILAITVFGIAFRHRQK